MTPVVARIAHAIDSVKTCQALTDPDLCARIAHAIDSVKTIAAVFTVPRTERELRMLSIALKLVFEYFDHVIRANCACYR